MSWNKLPIVPGIGYGNDLEVKLHENRDNRWYPQVQSGIYYVNAQEYYLFANEGSYTFGIPAGFSTHNVDGLTDWINAAKNGPIILYTASGRFTRSTNTFVAFYTATLSGSEDTMYTRVPGEPVLVTDANNNDLRQVDSPDDLYREDQYAYVPSSRDIYVKRAANSPLRDKPIYVSYISENHLLQQHEITFVKDNQVRTMYSPVFFSETPALSGYLPVITLPGSGSIPVSGVSENIILLGENLPNGTRVGVAYYVDGSWLLTVQSTYSAVVSALTSIPASGTLVWEKARHYNYYDAGTISSTSDEYVQLNPILTGIRNGFYYLGPPRHPAENFTTINVATFPTHVVNDFNQAVHIAAVALDNNFHPLPNITLSCFVSGGDAEGNPIIKWATNTSSNNRTGLDGRQHFVFTTEPEMLGLFTITVSGYTSNLETVVGTGSVFVSDPTILMENADSPKLYLRLGKTNDSNGLRELYIYVANHIGIPCLHSVDIKVYCNSGTLYTYQSADNNTMVAGNEIVINTALAKNVSGARVYKCKYKAVVGDTIYAKPIIKYEAIAWLFKSNVLVVEDA